MARTAVFVALAFLCGAALVLFVGPAPDDPPPAEVDTSEIDALRGEVASLRRRLRQAASRDRPGTPAADAVAAERPRRTAEELADHPEWVEDEIARRVAIIRREARQTAAEAEETAREQVLVAIRLERALREEVGRAGVIALLRGLRKDPVRMWEVVSDSGRFGALFEPRTEGPTLDGVTLRPGALSEDGTSIVYPAGRYRLDTSAWRSRKSFPRDVTISGQGMDQTLLDLTEELQMSGVVDNLTFRDVTINTSNNYLESMRGEPYSLRLVRCRVVGFDMGAGSSCMLGGSLGAFYATDCRFEAGYSRARAGYGSLFDVRGTLLARVEKCTIVGPFQSVYYGHGGATTQVFDQCRFESTSLRLRERLEGLHETVRFVDCTFQYEKTPTHRLRRALMGINSSWRAPTPPPRPSLVQPK